MSFTLNSLTPLFCARLPVWIGSLLLWLAGPVGVWAQVRVDTTRLTSPPGSSTAPATTPALRRLPPDSLTTPYGLLLADSTSRARDSLRYTRLKASMSKRRLTRE